MMNRRSLFLMAAMFCAVISVSGETVRERLKADSKFKLYTVIFGVVVDTDSQIQTFHVSKVIDPQSGKTDAVDVKVPGKYVDAARKKFSSRKPEPKMKDGKPVEFFTYYHYSPEYPDVVISDLDAAIDKQP